MTNEALKTALSDELAKLLPDYPEIVVLCSDSKGSSGFSTFSSQNPENFIEVGIAEQNEVGIAAGLASAGMKPYIAAPAAFLSARAAEQVKVDVAYSHSNVKLFGVSGGISYGALGASHYSVNDIAVMRSFPDLDVFIPSDAMQIRAIARYSLTTKRGCYIRAGRSPVPVIYKRPEEAFRYGKANMLSDGNDATIIACGEMTATAIKAASILEEKGMNIRVLDMPCIKPLDIEAIKRATEDTKAIITLEEHSIYGGLGSAVAETLSESSTPVKIIGFPDEYLITGNSEEIKEHYRMTADAIAEDVEKFIRNLK